MSPAKRIPLPGVAAIGQDLKAAREELARYHGAISRWCAMTGNAQPVPEDGDRCRAEFEAFNNHLTELQHARRIEF